MQVIDLQQIAIGDRQRSAPSESHIRELKESIIKDGLFHPIVLTQDYRLVAGFCRYTALKALSEEGISYLHNRHEMPPGHVPFVFANSIEEKELFRAELEENIRRENLTPADRAKAVAKLHELFGSDSADWTQSDTAKRLVERGMYQSSDAANTVVSRSLLVAQYADDPDVMNATSDKEAYRIARKKTEAILTQALGLMNAELPEDLMQNRLIEGSFFDKIDELPSNFFDCVIMDPPYGISADKFGDQAFILGHGYSDEAADFDKFLDTINDPYFLCTLKSECHLFLFLDIRQFPEARERITSSEWYVWQTPLIWFKGTLGHAPQPDQGPRRSYEAILYANRGKRPVRKTGFDVLNYPSVSDKLHAAQKPPGLYKELLSWTCNPGNVVLDPCCGSGTVFEAVKGSEGWIAWGIELSPETANIARSRL